MSDLTPEGFAFFRWHALHYGKADCSCWRSCPWFFEWAELNP